MTNKKTSRSLGTEKTLNLLMLFGEHQELTVPEMAELLNMQISSVYRIINTMKDLNFLNQSKDKSYSLKPANILKLYNNINKSVIHYAKPILKEIVSDLKESLYLSELYGDDQCIILAKEDGLSSLIWKENVGSVYNLPTGVVGKTHLAYLIRDMDKDIADALLSRMNLIKYTDKSITDLPTLKESLQNIIVQGHCLTKGEHIEGVIGISVPIFNSKNECRFVLTLTMASSKYRDEDKEAYVRVLKEGAEKIGQHID